MFFPGVIFKLLCSRTSFLKIKKNYIIQHLSELAQLYLFKNFNLCVLKELGHFLLGGHVLFSI